MTPARELMPVSFGPWLRRADRWAAKGFAAFTGISQKTFLLSLSAAWLVIVLMAAKGINSWDGPDYAIGALLLHAGEPLAGPNHWSLRWPLIGPMAVLFEIFGPSQFAAVVPNILYSAGTLLVTYFASRRLLGEDMARVLTVLVLLTVNIVIRPIEVMIDGPELFYVVASLWSLLIGLEARGRPALRWMVLSGLAAGGAWLCRESTVFLPVVIALTALVRRERFWQIGLAAGGGFLAVLFLEWLFYFTVAGDPFYRLNLSLNHGEGNPGASIGAERFTTTPPLQFITEPLGELFIHPLVTPVVLFGMAAGWLLHSNRSAFTHRAKQATALFGAAALLSFVICSFVLSLEWPLYYPVVPYAAVLVFAVAAVRFLPRYPALVSLVLAGFIGLQILLALLRTDPGFTPNQWMAQELVARDIPSVQGGANGEVLRVFTRVEGWPEGVANDRITLDDPDTAFVIEVCPYRCPAFETRELIVSRQFHSGPAIFRPLRRFVGLDPEVVEAQLLKRSDTTR
jgi:4-amino-4-deoxy-L-arabinose transferase-like glycosyltransferase